jgi:hypothetical protein
VKHLILVLALVGVASPVFAQSKTIAVFVTSDGAGDGFTDPNKGNQDTMKDLRDSLKGRKSIAIAQTREVADIVLVVMDREKSQLTISGFSGLSRDCVVRVKFIHKDTETMLSGSATSGQFGSGGGWGRAAGKVAKQVEQWIDANKDKL